MSRRITIFEDDDGTVEIQFVPEYVVYDFESFSEALEAFNYFIQCWQDGEYAETDELRNQMLSKQLERGK